MKILVDLHGFTRTFELDYWQDNTTLSDLILAAGGPHIAPNDPLYLDAQPLQGASQLGSVALLEGSIISQRPIPVAQPVRGWNITLAGGTRAGDVVPLPKGRPLIVGRSPQADIVLPTESASWEHCRIERTEEGIKISDAGSTNGTFVNGIKIPEEGVETDELTVIYTGGAVLLLRPQLVEHPAPKPGTLPNLTPARTAPFNRPPRSGMLPEADPIKLPKRKQITKPSKFSYATALSPLVLAVAMIAVMGDIRFAFFALLSPIAIIAMWAEQRWRYKRDTREEEERFAKDLEKLRQELKNSYGYERTRLHEQAPDPASVLRRVQLPSTELWQRRFLSRDFLSLHVGYGNFGWAPTPDNSSHQDREKEVTELIDASTLSGAPVIADISNAGVIGIVGERQGALALARSLLIQAVTHCGPADTTVGVFFDKGKEDEWAWTSWLPHTRQSGSAVGGRWISNDREQSMTMLKSLRQGIDGLLSPGLLLLIDSEVLTEGRDAPARELLGYGRNIKNGSSFSIGGNNAKDNHRVSGIVIATSEEQLPASCTVVINVEEDDAAAFTEPEKRRTVEDVIIGGITLEAATTTAHQLAQFDDPELVIPGAGLPSLVRLPELTGVGTPTPQKIAEKWRNATGFSTEIGVGDQGVYTLDLVKDGPHGLVGGTTGSGKSEFLRSLVAGLATHNDPTRLNFILIDFKGGAAFKACERLPHTIGTISNLDEQLANRALISLEAEMERRQRLFAAAGEGVDNITEYLATNPPEPMPRLLLVIDEFAMLAKDFPDVLSSLVSVGAVGRTLGVHMILATQRPAGVVNNDILANTNLRVALRVQSKEDSSNVIEVPDAASIERSQMGRAYIKLGQTDITPIQTALVTGFSGVVERAPIELRSTNIFGVPEAPRALPKPKKTDANDLDNLIDAIIKAGTEQGVGQPRKVWPNALGERVPLAGFTNPDDDPETADTDTLDIGAVQGTTVFFALADIPHEQRQIPQGWDMERSNLLMVGAPGSGTSTSLISLALTLCLHSHPDEFDMLILDMGAGTLAPLQNLPHVSSYVGPGEGAKERQTRFLRHLMVELDRRRSNPFGNRRIVVLVDGFGTLKDEFSEYTGTDYLSAFYRIYSDGPALGMHIAMTSSRIKGIPSVVDDVSLQRWLFHLADPYDYSGYKIRGTDIPAPVPGRCVESSTIRQMHVATPVLGTESAVKQVQQRWGEADKPDVIGQLPSLVPLSTLAAQPEITHDRWVIPVGIAEHNLQPVSLELYEGEHALIGGSPRSGKSSLLQAIGDSVVRLREQHPQGVNGLGTPQVWVICGRRSPLLNHPFDRIATKPEQIDVMISDAGMTTAPLLLLIDDAERIDDSKNSIKSLVEGDYPLVHVVASGKPDEIRTMYSHWLKDVRKSRTGVLLQPNVDYDGDIFSITLPRRSPVALTTGRGYVVVGGSSVLAQAVSPDGTE